MTERRENDAPENEAKAGRHPARDYEPPRLIRLGSLADLTRGGTAGPPDMFGGAGDSGSL
jgi:hypothetical protein